MTSVFVSYSPDDLPGISRQIIRLLGSSRVVALYGAMGIGKTTLIKALCNTLGSIDLVTSPTFALVNQYGTPEGKILYHFDFYRINSILEAMDMGYEEYFYSGEYCFIEWPEKIETLLPTSSARIKIYLGANDNERIIELNNS